MPTKDAVKQQKSTVKQQCGIIAKKIASYPTACTWPEFGDMKEVEKKLDELIEFLGIS